MNNKKYQKRLENYIWYLSQELAWACHYNLVPHSEFCGCGCRNSTRHSPEEAVQHLSQVSQRACDEITRQRKKGESFSYPTAVDKFGTLYFDGEQPPEENFVKTK
jgi:hypothetical protein